jgi:hypothetical protein
MLHMQVPSCHYVLALLYRDESTWPGKVWHADERRRSYHDVRFCDRNSCKGFTYMITFQGACFVLHSRPCLGVIVGRYSHYWRPWPKAIVPIITVLQIAQLATVALTLLRVCCLLLLLDSVS